MAPGILRDVGDVAHLAALVAPRRVVIAGGVAGDGKPLATRAAPRRLPAGLDRLGVDGLGPGAVAAPLPRPRRSSGRFQ